MVKPCDKGTHPQQGGIVSMLQRNHRQLSTKCLQVMVALWVAVGIGKGFQDNRNTVRLLSNDWYSSLSLSSAIDTNTTWFSTMTTGMTTSSQTMKDASDDVLFCQQEGSLHQIALDMIQFSSPPGSPSRKKLKHVLDQNSAFYISLGPIIFRPMEESLAAMLEGYGMTRVTTPPALINDTHNDAHITVVETAFSRAVPDPVCSSTTTIDGNSNTCRNRTRILVQSEQVAGETVGGKYGRRFEASHLSATCIIWEFSDYNYLWAKERGWADSFVLLPVMTQQPSRLSTLVPAQLPPLSRRSLDVVFFGVITRRREVVVELAQNYTRDKNWTTQVTKVRPRHTTVMAQAYADAKVCLVTHSYLTEQGGEYHRMSEFAPFGCIPVMERFADTFAMDRYERCGRVVFADLEQLFDAAEQVIAKIGTTTENEFENLRHIDWWKARIRWEELLTTIFGDQHHSKVPQ